MKSNAPYAAAYRKRQSEKLARRGEALQAALKKLEGNTKQLLSTGFYRLCNPKGWVM